MKKNNEMQVTTEQENFGMKTIKISKKKVNEMQYRKAPMSSILVCFDVENMDLLIYNAYDYMFGEKQDLKKVDCLICKTSKQFVSYFKTCNSTWNSICPESGDKNKTYFEYLLIAIKKQGEWLDLNN